MKEQEFKLYLKECGQSGPTIQSKISRLKRIEKHYENLDDKFKNNTFDILFKKFELKNGVPQHKIIIKGNQSEGTASFKSALGSYYNFKMLENEVDYKPKVYSDDPLYQKITKIIKKLKLSQKKELPTDLKNKLYDDLEKNITEIKWETEAKISDKYGDRVDILGRDSNRKIIIELDAARADQVAKKCLSRIALTLNENIIYISLCYPGTGSMSKNECQKYFIYCNDIIQSLYKSDCDKKYFGYFLI